MGFISKIFRKSVNSGGGSLDLILRGLINPTVRFETYVWIFASAKKIAETGSQVGFKIVDKNGTPVEKYESYFKKPSPQSTFRELIEATLGMMTIYGKAFWITDGVNIEVLDNRFIVNFERRSSGFSFDVFTGKGWRQFTQDNAVVFYDTLSFANLLVKDVLFKTASLGSKIEELNDNLLERGGFIPGYFTTEQSLTAQQRKAIREEWERSYAGYMNAGRPPVLEGGLKLERFGLTPQDMQFSEMEKLVLDRISAVLGVPSSLLNKTDRINYATAKVQKELFWEGTIIPKLRKIEERINYFVLPLLKIKDVVFMLDLSSIKALQEDEESRARIYDVYVRNGVMTINEVRKLLGLEPVKYGDYYWGGASTVPLASKVFKQADDREKKWKRFDTLLKGMETRLYKEMLKEFRRQRKEVKQRIEANKMAVVAKINEDDLINSIDWGDFILSVEELVLPLWSEFATEGADVLRADLLLDVSYNVVNPTTIEYIKNHALEMARQINETTREDLRQHIASAIAEAVNAGASTDKIKDAIMEAVDDTFDITESRAYIIARTETARAVNWGQNEFAKNCGIPLKKKWLSARDSAVRPSHREADGQIADLYAPFIVDGEALEYPGDPNASPGNTINCRCTVEYVPEE